MLTPNGLLVHIGQALVLDTGGSESRGHGFLFVTAAYTWDQLLIAEPEGPSFISRTVAQRRLDRRYS